VNEEMKAFLTLAAKMFGYAETPQAKEHSAGHVPGKVKGSNHLLKTVEESSESTENSTGSNVVITREEYEQLIKDRDSLYTRRAKQAGYQRKRAEKKNQLKMRSGPHFNITEQINQTSQVA
jgi:hypothetical protein